MTQNRGGQAQNYGGQPQNDGGYHTVAGDTVRSTVYKYSAVQLARYSTVQYGYKIMCIISTVQYNLKEDTVKRYSFKRGNVSTGGITRADKAVSSVNMLHEAPWIHYSRGMPNMLIVQTKTNWTRLPASSKT